MLKLTRAWIIASLLLIGCGLTGAVLEQVNTSSPQTLTNKTLMAPVIATIVNTGTLTLPTSTDTLVGRATTDTLTNKVLSSPVVASPTFSGTTAGVHTYTLSTLSGTALGAYTLAGTPTITAPAISSPVLSGSVTGVYSLEGTPTIFGAFLHNTTISSGGLNLNGNDITNLDELALTDAAANATAAGRLRRNGTAVTWHDGTTANVLRPTLATPQASTSGTVIDFTGIPAGTRRITIEFVGVGTNGTDDIWAQLGDAGGVEETGYLGAKSILAATVSTARITTAFGVSGSAAGAILHGTVTLTLENAANFTWVESGALSRSDADFLYQSAGSKSLSAELDRVRIATGGAVNTFDAGAINITYE